MKKYIAVNLFVNCIYITFFIIFLCIGSGKMTPWWVTLLAAVIPSVLSCIVTLFISRKSQINKNSDSIKALSKSVSKLKDSQKKYCENISSEIGRTINDKTLTAQHPDLQNMLQKEIDIVEQRYEDEEKRIRDFTLEQLNMNEKVENLKLIMESWKRLSEENNYLKREILRSEKEIEELKTKNKILKENNQSKGR